jgi:hypothetical protein
MNIGTYPIESQGNRPSAALFLSALLQCPAHMCYDILVHENKCMHADCIAEARCLVSDAYLYKLLEDRKELFLDNRATQYPRDLSSVRVSLLRMLSGYVHACLVQRRGEGSPYGFRLMTHERHIYIL